jgi:hypothetical protein
MAAPATVPLPAYAPIHVGNEPIDRPWDRGLGDQTASVPLAKLGVVKAEMGLVQPPLLPEHMRDQFLCDPVHLLYGRIQDPYTGGIVHQIEVANL